MNLENMLLSISKNLETIRKHNPDRVDYYLYAPMNEQTALEISREASLLQQEEQEMLVYTNTGKLISSPNSSGISIEYSTSTDNTIYSTTYVYDNGRTVTTYDNEPQHIDLLYPQNALGEKRVLAKIENRITEYIYNNFDINYIKDNLEGVYQTLSERIYELIEDVVKEEQDDGTWVSDIEEVTETYYNNTDFNYYYAIIDEIRKQPVTMEEKLADIGMSQRDFL